MAGIDCRRAAPAERTADFFDTRFSADTVFYRLRYHTISLKKLKKMLMSFWRIPMISM